MSDKKHHAAFMASQRPAPHQSSRHRQLILRCGDDVEFRLNAAAVVAITGYCHDGDASVRLDTCQAAWLVHVGVTAQAAQDHAAQIAQHVARCSPMPGSLARVLPPSGQELPEYACVCYWHSGAYEGSVQCVVMPSSGGHSPPSPGQPIRIPTSVIYFLGNHMRNLRKSQLLGTTIKMRPDAPLAVWSLSDAPVP